MERRHQDAKQTLCTLGLGAKFNFNREDEKQGVGNPRSDDHPLEEQQSMPPKSC